MNITKIICVLGALVILLSACAQGGPGVAAFLNQDGVKVEVKVVEPIKVNEWTPIDVTITTEKAIEDGILTVSIEPLHGEVESYGTRFDLAAGETKTFSNKIKYAHKGYSPAFVVVVTNEREYVANLRVNLTETGGRVLGPKETVTNQPLIETPMPFPTQEGQEATSTPVPFEIAQNTISIAVQYTYYNRDGCLGVNAGMKVRFMDQDGAYGGTDDDILYTTWLDADGRASMLGYSNNDADVDGGKLDIYLKFESLAQGAKYKVTNLSSVTYKWWTGVHPDLNSGSYSWGYGIPQGNTNLPAAWIFSDLRRRRLYVVNQGYGPVSGATAAKWQDGVQEYNGCNNSCFWPYTPVGGEFIQDTDAISPDNVNHEQGHNYMYNLRGGDMWWDIGNFPAALNCFNHLMFKQEDQLCAQTEGWADWFAVTVNGDACFDMNFPGSCGGTRDGDYYNLDTHNELDNSTTFNFGDGVEGRVAGAYLDLDDGSVDGPDDKNYDFRTIWDNSILKDSFNGFWWAWPEDRNAGRAILSWNTIDYSYP